MNVTFCLRVLLLAVTVVSAAGHGQLSDYMDNLTVQSPSTSAKACTRSAQCGHGGCCLRGRCSNTGSTFDRCYARVRHNGRIRPVKLWKKTDVCPCEYASYCYVQRPYEKHPVYGPVGSCFPIMR
ncbi:unnamed protein product [Lymnaea stagnalis]|uniref:Uncharacterized protein n=1 Tax=Lymnaea stagnalis TaxID=6523 RepID=A0AAV2HB18_LYMST